MGCSLLLAEFLYTLCGEVQGADLSRLARGRMRPGKLRVDGEGRTREMSSVFDWRFFQVIDHDYLHRDFLRLKAKTESLLNGRAQGRCRFHLVVGRVPEYEVVNAFHAGLVDHHFVQ